MENMNYFQSLSPVSSDESSSVDSFHQGNGTFNQMPVPDMCPNYDYNEMHYPFNTGSPNIGAWQQTSGVMPISPEWPNNLFQQFADTYPFANTAFADMTSAPQCQFDINQRFYPNTMGQSSSFPQDDFPREMFDFVNDDLGESTSENTFYEQYFPTNPQFHSFSEGQSTSMGDDNFFWDQFMRFSQLDSTRNSQSPERRTRTVYTASQLATLEREFSSNKYVSVARRHQLAQSMNLTSVQLKVWFQNRRMKEKNEKKDQLSPDLTIQTLFTTFTADE